MSSPSVNIWPLCVSAAVSLGCFSLINASLNQVLTVWSALVGIGLSAALALSVVVVVIALSTSSDGNATLFDFCRLQLGSPITSIVLWSLLGELVLAVALLAKTCTHIVNLLSKRSLIDFLKKCCTIGGEPTWSFYDPVSSILIIIAGFICAISAGQRTSRIIKGLLVVNAATIISTIIFLAKDFGEDTSTDIKRTTVTSLRAVEDLVQTGGLYSLVFVILLSSILISNVCTRNSWSIWSSPIFIGIISAVSMVVAFYRSTMVRSAQLDIATDPIAILSEQENAHWVLKMTDIGALISCLVGLASAILLSKQILKIMCDQGFVWQYFGGNFRSVIATTILALLLSSFQNFSGVLESVSPGAFFVYQSLIIVSILQGSSRQSVNTDSHTVWPKPLKTAWLFYFITSPIFVNATNYFGGAKTQEAAIQAVSIWAILTIIQLVLDKRPVRAGSMLHQVMSSLLLAVSSFIMCHLNGHAWLRYLVWSVLGLVVHFTSVRYRSIKQPLTQVSSTSQGADNLAFQAECRSNIRSRASFASARSFSVASFLSMDMAKTWSFCSARDGFDSKSACLSFCSAREHFETRSACLSTQSALNNCDMQITQSNTETTNDLTSNQILADGKRSVVSIGFPGDENSKIVNQNEGDNFSVYSIESSEMFDAASNSSEVHDYIQDKFNGEDEMRPPNVSSSVQYCKVDVHPVRDKDIYQQCHYNSSDASSTYRQQYASEAAETQVQGCQPNTCKSSVDQCNISCFPTISQASVTLHRTEICQDYVDSNAEERASSPNSSDHTSVSACRDCDLSMCHMHPESTDHQGPNTKQWRATISRSSGGDTRPNHSLSSGQLVSNTSPIVNDSKDMRCDGTGSCRQTQTVDISGSQSVTLIDSDVELTELPARIVGAEIIRSSSSASDKISDHDSGFSVELSQL